MSVVLYALGVALLAWGGYVLLSGDMIATLDIAASLAGSGAFAIGLGAVAGAIKRLARTIAEQGALRAGAADHGDERDLPPLQALRRAAPHPVATHDPEPELAADLRARIADAPEPAHPALAALEAALEPEPAPRTRPRIEVQPERAPAVEPAAAPVLSKTERRRLRALDDAKAQAAAEPPLGPPQTVATILGGGLAAHRAEAEQEPEANRAVALNQPPAPRLPRAERPSLTAAPPAEPAPVAPEPAPEQAAPAPQPVGAAAEPSAPSPVDVRPDPKVPEWLARARARREARAKAEASDDAAAGAGFVAAPSAVPEAEDVPADAAAAEAPAAAEETLERVVLREGEHNGVLYRFYADGSVEAQSEHGMRRFGSLEELRATVLAVRGHIEGEAEDDPDARPEAEMMVAPAAEHAFVPEADEGAVTAEPPPAETRPDDDFEAALAALEGRATDDRDAGYEPPRLDEIRPGRDR